MNDTTPQVPAWLNLDELVPAEDRAAVAAITEQLTRLRDELIPLAARAEVLFGRVDARTRQLHTEFAPLLEEPDDAEDAVWNLVQAMSGARRLHGLLLEISDGSHPNEFRKVDDARAAADDLLKESRARYTDDEILAWRDNAVRNMREADTELEYADQLEASDVDKLRNSRMLWEGHLIARSRASYTDDEMIEWRDRQVAYLKENDLTDCMGALDLATSDVDKLRVQRPEWESAQSEETGQ